MPWDELHTKRNHNNNDQLYFTIFKLLKALDNHPDRLLSKTHRLPKTAERHTGHLRYGPDVVSAHPEDTGLRPCSGRIAKSPRAARKWSSCSRSRIVAVLAFGSLSRNNTASASCGAHIRANLARPAARRRRARIGGRAKTAAPSLRISLYLH